MQVVAHRGLTLCSPENSVLAVRAAVAAGLEFVEVDVRASADGIPFAMHDQTLDRTTDGWGSIARWTASSLREVYLHDGSQIPSLAEIVRETDGRATLCIDLKQSDAWDAVHEVVAGLAGRVEVWSYDAGVVWQASAAGFATVLNCSGLLRRGPGEFLWKARECGAQRVSFFPADIEPYVARACHNAGIPFQSGTPNDRATWGRLERMGASRLVTDKPLALLQMLRHAPRPGYRVGREIPERLLKEIDGKMPVLERKVREANDDPGRAIRCQEFARAE